MTNESPEPTNERKPFKIQRLAIGTNVILQLAAFAAIVLMVNYIGFRQFKRWDLSRDQKYALSPMTKNLLNSLKEPVKAIIFFPQEQMLAPDVGALLQEYSYASGRKFTVEQVDPYRNLIRAKELAEKYKFGGTDNIVILDYKGKSKFVNAQEMADRESAGYGQPALVKSFKGEQAITSALLELTEEKQNKLYCVIGHGEPDVTAPEASDAAVGHTFGLKAYAQRQNLKLDTVNLSNVDQVPADASGLLIFGPRADFSEREMKLISDYWNDKKGRLFVLVDPTAKIPRLNLWLADQGVAPRNDRVLKTGTALTQDENGQMVVRSGILPAVGSFTPESKAVTKDLVGVNIQLFGPTQSLALDPTAQQIKKIKTTSLLQAGEGYWGETEYFPGDASRPVFFDTKKDHMGPLVLAAAAEKGGLEDPRVKVDTARMVVVGNASFLTDEGLQISDVGIDFAVNALNWIFNREQIAGIPPKPKEPVKLSLDERQLTSLAMTVLVTIPGIVAVIGLAVWWQRRA